ncbi:peptidase domain-containing ABC transporter [Priestia endophytica]|uniref:peptidase domain-containing ABC transporter n=1 Tax=Priestia endophytica TaxID=135735 RepID=UPI003D279740
MTKRKRKLPVILQTNKYDCGITCLAIVMSGEEKLRLNPKIFRGGRDFIGREGTNLFFLKETAVKYGYTFKAYRTTQLENLAHLVKDFPVILHWNHNHFVVLEKMDNEKASIIDPDSGRRAIPLDEFQEAYSGVAIHVKKDVQSKGESLSSVKEQHSFMKIGKYLFNNKKLISYIILLSFIFQILNLATPFLTQYIVDSFLEGKAESISLNMLSLFIILSVVLFFILSFVRMLFIIKLQVYLNKNMTNHFIQKIVSLPLKFFEVNSVGDIATRINNISVIREVISRLASTLILDISLLIVFCFVMLFYSPVLSVIVFAGAFVQVLSTKYLLPKIETYTKQEVNSQAHFQTQLVEVLRSMTFIKTIGNTATIEEGMKSSFNHQLNHFSGRMHYSSLLGAISNSVNLSLPLLVLTVGVWWQGQSALTIGAIVAFSSIASRFMTPLGSIIGSLESIKMVEEMVDRVESVLQEDDEQLNQDQPYTFNAKQDSITIRDLAFGYTKESYIFEKAHMEIHPGEKMMIVGKTGSGKSTLLKVISGLYEPTDGEIHYGNQERTKINLMKLRETMGFIVQDINLFNDTILNNIKYFSETVSDESAVEAAKQACIHDDIMKMPMGYHTVIGENGISLSGGQRQRIAIARVLAKQPQILLIDEGTSNLDKETETKVLQNIYNKQITVVAITHRTDWLQHADSIYEIKEGKVTLVKQKNKQYLVSGD